MKIYKYIPREFACNSYVVTNDGKTAAVIDCGSVGLYEYCNSLNLTPKAVLLTHGHFDHVGGCGEFYGRGVPIYCGENEKNLIFSPAYKTMFGGVYVPPFQIKSTFSDGEETEVCGIKFKVISTPGHSAGSVCYVTDNYLFSGDTLFCGSFGRTDLPTGDFAELLKSIQKLFALSGDYKVYCGHEGETTLNYERKNNPCARFR